MSASTEHRFTPEELRDLQLRFESFDSDDSGQIDPSELATLLRALNMTAGPAQISRLVALLDTDHDGQISWEEFLAAMIQLKSGTADEGLAKVLVGLQSVHYIGKGTTVHAYALEERIAFAGHINDVLEGDSDLTGVLPINQHSSDLFAAVTDGILLCKLINASVEHTIDVRAINRPKPGSPLNKFKIQENLTLAINAARAIGCSVVNIGAQDLANGPNVPHLVLGLLWQVIRIGLLGDVNIQLVPGLVLLLNEGEDLNAFLRLPPRDILIRWVNYHLAQAGTDLRIRNLTTDIKDSKAYTYLISQIGKDRGTTLGPLSESDLLTRAELVLQEAAKLGCRKFVRPADIVTGNKKLNLAFVATLFNAYPALVPPADFSLDDLEDDESKSREARTYTRWLNSLGLGTPVHSLFDDLDDGLQLLRAEDLMRPGTVEWSKVEMKPNHITKRLLNCSKAVAYGKAPFGFSLVGIGGKDIHFKNVHLIYSLLWQMMRFDSVKLLSSLMGQDHVTDKAIFEWANAKLTDASYSQYKIKNFKDQRIRSGYFFAALVDAVKPGAIDWSLMSDGTDMENRRANAKYVISRARAIGANVYALWEDVAGTEGMPKPNQKACLLIAAAIWVASTRP